MKSSTEDGDSGKIVNLLTNDLAKFDYAFFLIHEVWKGPLQSLLYLLIIYSEVGWAGVIGLAFLLSFIPLQGKTLLLFSIRIVFCFKLKLNLFYLQHGLVRSRAIFK